MNEVWISIEIRDRETKERVRYLGDAAHVIADPGEDVQSVHGWRNYVAERVSLAVKATVAAELTRESVLARAPKLSGFCPRCGEKLGDGELLPDPDADGKPAHVECLADLREPLSFEEAARQKGLGDLEFRATPAIVSDLLLLLGEGDIGRARPSMEEIESWTDEEREAVATWAAANHAFASDNDEVEIPPYPAALLRGSDDAANAGDDAGAKGEASGAAGAAPAGGEAGAAPASGPGEAAGDGGDPATAAPASSGEGDRADPEAAREAHAGSDGGEAGSEGSGEVSRPRTRRRGSAKEGGS